MVLRPDPEKGLVFESETPAGTPGAVDSSNAGGVPEPCSPVEAKPLGTCANPHGIQIRADLGRMVTADYAEPRELVIGPVKPYKPGTFPPTVRVWDITALSGDSTAAWTQVFDDDMAVPQTPRDDRTASCVGGSWHQVSPDSRFLFRTVMGRNPGSCRSSVSTTGATAAPTGVRSTTTA